MIVKASSAKNYTQAIFLNLFITYGAHRAVIFAIARLSCHICDNLARRHPILPIRGRNIPREI